MWRDRVAGRPVDVVLTLGLMIAGQFEVVYGSVGYQGKAPVAVSAVLAVLIPLPLLWRRRAPLLSLVLVGLAIGVPTLLVDRSIPFWGGPMTLDVAVYSASRYASPPRDRWALLVPAVAVGLVAVAIPSFRSLNEVAFSGGVYGVGWAAGQVMRGWQRRHEQLGSDLLTLAESAALREQAAAAAERTRIARELHDVVAHSVSLMVVQAGSARLRLQRDPAAAEEALRVVEDTGREALGELRQLLGVLRTDADPNNGDPTGIDPSPGLAGIGDLATQLRGSGLDLQLEVCGVRRDLPPGLDLSAYRIVQEALTNVLKHAGPTTATVRITYQTDELDLRVSNDRGRRTSLARAAAGHGLLGMRERVTLFGGRLKAGPRPDGGYLVHATLPLPEIP